MSARKRLVGLSGQLGTDSLSAVRERAAASFAENGFPTRRMEDWKYTDLSIAREISEQALNAGDGENASAVQAPDDIDAYWLPIANGQPVVTDFPAIPGVTIKLLSESDLDLRFDLPLADLNLALLSDGIHLQIDKNAKLDKPIGLLFVDHSGGQALVSQGRVVVNVGRHAEVEFVELHLSSGDAPQYANIFVDVSLADSARVNYARLQLRDWQSVQTSHLAVELGRHAHFEHFAVDIGGVLVRNDVKVDIVEPGASVALNGLYLSDQGQHVDNHLRVDHRVGPAISHQEYRGIVKGHAVWNGKAIVHKGADGTDANQTNHNLLVADTASVDTKPELEIYAEDVKCSHGTTVGQLDDDGIFYLRTRCLSEDQARKIMTHAFANAVVQRCPVAACQTWVGDRVNAALDALVGEHQG